MKMVKGLVLRLLISMKFKKGVNNSRDRNFRFDCATFCGEEKPMHGDEKKGAECHKVAYTRIFSETITHMTKHINFCIGNVCCLLHKKL